MNDVTTAVGVPVAFAMALADLHAVGLRVAWTPVFGVAADAAGLVADRSMVLSATGVGVDTGGVVAWTCEGALHGLVPCGTIHARGEAWGELREATASFLARMLDALRASLRGLGGEEGAPDVRRSIERVGSLFDRMPSLWPTAEEAERARAERARRADERLVELGIDPSAYRLIVEEQGWLCLRERLVTKTMEPDEYARTFWVQKPDRAVRRMPVVMPVRVAVLALVPGAYGRFLAMESPSHADEEEVPSDYLRVGESIEDAARRVGHDRHVDLDVRHVLADERAPREGDPGEERRVVIAAVVRDLYGREQPMSATVPGMLRGAFGFVLESAEEAFHESMGVAD